ncbi:TetR/AcrR family transcriptional regulator C-terminal domain-containing protein [Gordonia humi]|uniref:TetR/AcrR family transcriptional regulator C-terminal domain-containing protein n=1 Tax=Gordonia humi TaxID=686429 RepID=UPI0033801207
MLSVDAIVASALDEIAEVGVHGLSVRSVARRLGVDSKSLYHYIDGKDDLLVAVADHILSTVPVPEPTGELDADLRAFARAFRRHALRHPQATSLVLTRQPRSLASLVPLEVALSLLVDAGYDPVQAVHLLRLVMATLVGTILRESEMILAGDAVDGQADRWAQALAGSGLPVVASAAPDIAVLDSDAEFEFGLDAMVRFILEDVARHRSP